ncbi:lipoprotein N-acyltransferase Lnb domain-containing protein [Winogradskyella arenosi]|uniref:Uncharacterized protein DUF4105 n=1 Tax=Winogradskyella arenosi TaxID=533325 RepID=A0A368ZE77_9FLAO|nr:DUF4105 domain-containing protein [Winogradskyella arenosi]RCW91488.1 uncharacterized protein DUF4105 [Winogradskyella arenosi]
MKVRLSFLVLLFTFSFAFTQPFQLSENAKISVLTVGPGTSLNDAFGHNAFRIKDPSRGIDVVYGYGEYDFDAPNFYLKFAQGKLNYLISRHPFQNFFYAYKRANRTIEEQVLNLTSEDKQHLFDYLENNYKPDNRRYLYDFFYDNCATRIRDVSQISTQTPIVFTPPPSYEPKTFRTLIHEHVGLNTWGSFSIDLALGSVIDQKASPEEFMFLPKYIHAFFATAKLNANKPLVKSSATLYQKKDSYTPANSIGTPLVIIGLLAIGILFITYKDKKNKTRSVWLDVTLFALTGLISVVLLLLWFATDHSATAFNYNLLWAFPLNLFVIGQLRTSKAKTWFIKYLKLLVILLCLLTMHWIIGVQVFALGLLPFLIALFLRYLYIIQWYRNHQI